MCFSKPQPVQDNSAKVAREQEVARQKAITAGQGQIDSAFQAFDPAYFSRFQQDYLNAYNPEVDRQFGVARQKLRYSTARAGTADSTSGQNQFGDILRTYGDARRGVAENAMGAADDLRNRVNQQKTALYQQNTAAADPSLAAQSALSAAGSLATAPKYSPLGDIFGGLVNGAGAYIAGRNQALPAGYAPLFASSAFGGSPTRVVK